MPETNWLNWLSMNVPKSRSMIIGDYHQVLVIEFLALSRINHFVHVDTTDILKDELFDFGGSLVYDFQDNAHEGTELNFVFMANSIFLAVLVRELALQEPCRCLPLAELSGCADVFQMLHFNIGLTGL